jgi:hypothetical protein
LSSFALEEKTKRSWCTLTCHICTSCLLEERFLQHHFSNVFCSTASTSLLQHCFNTTLQHCLLQ